MFVRLAVALAWLAAASRASLVLDLTEDELAELQQGDQASFVLFYAPWCGHCKAVKPVFEDLARFVDQEYEGSLVVAKVDCTVEGLACQNEDVSGYPTFKFYEGHSEPGIQYTQGRTLKGFKMYLAEMMAEIRQGAVNNYKQSSNTDVAEPAQTADGVWQLTEDTFEPFTEERTVFVKFFAPWCKHCQAMAEIWKDLARSGVQGVSIAEVDCTQQEDLCEAEEVEGYPALYLYQDGDKVAMHAGKRERAELLEFLASWVDPAIAQEQGKLDSSAENDKSSKNNNKVEYTNSIATITNSNVRAAVTLKPVVLVAACVPWSKYCEGLSALLEGVKGRARDALAVAQVNCAKYPKQCSELQVKAYPEFILFRDGRAQKSRFSGDRTVDALLDFCQV